MRLAAVMIAALASTGASAQEEPVRVPGPHGGYAAYQNQQQKQSHDRWGFAAARRAGDYVYLSGVVVGAGPDETLDTEAFKERVRSTFARANDSFKAAGASIDEVVDIISFHVFDSPRLADGKLAQLDAMAEVKREFMPGADPAWTAIGVSELLPDNGFIEIRMVAYSPAKG